MRTAKTITGAISTGATVTVFSGIHSWTQMPVALAMLALMFFVGFITGGLLAADKFIRSLPDTDY